MRRNISSIALVLTALLFSVSPAHAQIEQSDISTNSSDSVLHGSLLMPSAKKPVVVLIIAGSGPTDRDGNSMAIPGKNNSLKMLAEELAKEGFASVRYDKRGVGASISGAKSEEDLRFQLFADDARSWIKQLNSDSRFNGVVVLGHSEGSSIGLVAAKASNVRGFISVAGPAQAAGQILRNQLQGKLPPDLAAQNERILTQLEKGDYVIDVPAPLLALYRPSVQPYLISWFAIKPSQVISQLNVPVAIFQGDTDMQVPVSEANLLAKAQPKATLQIVKGMNHVLKQVPAEQNKQLASYGDAQLPIDSGFIKAVVDFLKKL